MTLDIDSVGAHNTPANDKWILFIQFRRTNETFTTTIPIYFHPTGDIDFSKTSQVDFNLANRLMFPASFPLTVAAAENNVTLDFWKLLNWLYISFYWTVLADFGQISPTISNPRSGGLLSFKDFSTSTTYPSTNNIFVNNTLFTIYSSYMFATILPMLNISLPTTFAALDSENRLFEQDQSFARTYSCTVRQWKPPLTALISIVVAEYAFLKGAYIVFILIATWFQKRKFEDCINPLSYFGG